MITSFIADNVAYSCVRGQWYETFQDGPTYYSRPIHLALVVIAASAVYGKRNASNVIHDMTQRSMQHEQHLRHGNLR